MICVIALAWSRNLFDPFISDDYLLMNLAPFKWQAFVEHIFKPAGDQSWRPLGYAYFALTATVFGANPVKWHLLTLALHLVNSALLFRIAWKLWPNKAGALVAGGVFGLNGTRPEAVLWAAGSHELLATMCVLAGANVAMSDRFNPNVALVVSALMIAAGISIKESAYAAPLVLAAVLYQRKPCWPVVTAWIATCAAMFAWRWHIFGGPGGYRDPATGQSLLFSLRVSTTAKALLTRIWSILFVPLNWDAPARWWLPVSVLVSTVGVIWVLSCRHSDQTPGRKKQFVLMAAVIAASLPAIPLALIGQSALGSRVLYLPGAAFSLLLGSTLVGAGQRGVMAATVMLVGTIGILENNLGAWREAALKAETLCDEGAAGASVTPPETFEGVYVFRNGFAECVARKRAAPNLAAGAASH